MADQNNGNGDGSSGSILNLDTLRRRLLDLTNRNRLLNYWHTSKTCLQIVDELPDELFHRLSEGRQLTFIPVPEPPRQAFQPENEQTSNLFAESTVAIEETARRKPSAKEYARILGLNTSFELPKQSTGTPTAARHTDDKIQTLHYPDELENILQRVDSAARTTIEESGVNMLYLAFGFLEWYESDSSQDERLAPLIMMPVQLERKANKTNRRYEYLVAYSEEDIAFNDSLQEKLKQEFSIELPKWGEDDSPELYFDKVEAIFKSKPTWRIRRQITLTLLQFGKILMYRDLEPKNWPTQNLLHHDRVREFFHGTAHSTLDALEDCDIDAGAHGKKPLSLIANADHSQTNALLDALDGKNLVIEGPPGTGKSQTITNMIAALLVEGKNVLFVSEKLAALQVVRRRLDDAGIGMFCLELHSAKTQKKNLLEDIKTRLDARDKLTDSKALDTRLELLQSAKQELLDYRNILLSSFGAMKLSVFEILWKRERLLKYIGDQQSQQLESLSITDDIEKLTEADIQRTITLLSNFQNIVSQIVGQTATIKDHPWHGINNSDLTFAQEKVLHDQLRALRYQTDDLIAELTAFRDETGDQSKQTLHDIKSLSENLRSIPAIPSTVMTSLLQNLFDLENRACLKHYGKKASVYWDYKSRLLQYFKTIPEKVPAAFVTAIEEIRSRHTNLGLAAADCLRLRQFLDRAEHVMAALEQGERCYKQISRLFGWEAPYNADNLALLLNGIQCLAQAPLEALPFRRPNFAADTSFRHLERAMKVADELRKELRTWERQVLFRAVPEATELVQFASILNQKGIAGSFLNSSYRDARRKFYRWYRDQNKRSGPEMAAILLELSSFKEKLEAFEHDETWSQFFGEENFHGLNTAFDTFCTIVPWCQSIKVQVSGESDHAESLRQRLLAQHTAQLRATCEWINANQETVDCLKRLHDNLSSIVPLFPASIAKIAETDLTQFSSILGDFTMRVKNLVSDLQAFTVHDDVTIKNLDCSVNEFQKYWDARTQILEDARAISLLGSPPEVTPTWLAELSDTFAFCDVLDRLKVPRELLRYLYSAEFSRRCAYLAKFSETVSKVCDELINKHEAIIQLGNINVAEWFGEQCECASRIEVEKTKSRLSRALLARTELNGYLDFLRLRQECKQRGLNSISEKIESQSIPSDLLAHCVEYLAFDGMANELFERYPLLNRIGYQRLEQTRQRFLALDREIVELTRTRAAHIINKRSIPRGVTSGPVRGLTEMGLLDNEIKKQKRHIPIRQLVKRAGKALIALKPCFMMGPLSVAQYLEAGDFEFDVLIMDEASQLKPEEAIGAIARARQVIIVGDQKQLPPTSFFEKLFEEETDDPDKDYSSIVDAESILEQASKIYPSRDLRWHYRSRHGSLIAYSHHEFYNKRLIIFPSPVIDSPELGVKFVLVHDAYYEDGKNIREAERVVMVACEHMKRRPNESLGIVALNIAQRQVIEDLFYEAMKYDAEVQDYVSQRKSSLEPFFIKNLENVQGDERDVIFISCTYGKDPQGHFYQRFGPINGKNGHRRLNVLFTRAKLRVEAFCSFDPADLIVGDTKSSRGVYVLKTYLQYAKTKILEQATDSRGGAESDFENSVGGAVKDMGYRVETQVGVAGYFLDIAVRHPEKPDSFILGIECDGAAFHSGRCVRDRDRLRQEILEDLGWKIHRIWSTDWFRYKEKEIKKLQARIQASLATHA